MRMNVTPFNCSRDLKQRSRIVNLPKKWKYLSMHLKWIFFKFQIQITLWIKLLKRSINLNFRFHISPTFTHKIPGKINHLSIVLSLYSYNSLLYSIDVDYSWILWQGKNCPQFTLLILNSFIGQFVHPEGGEW